VQPFVVVVVVVVVVVLSGRGGRKPGRRLHDGRRHGQR
jgi:hypothetical protein